MRRTPSSIARTVACAAVVLCAFAAGAAQSGRRPAEGATPTPSPQPRAQASPPKPSVRVTKLVVAAKTVAPTVKYFRSTLEHDAITSCVERLREASPQVEAIRGGRMTRDEAVARARAEADTYVLWLEIALWIPKGVSSYETVTGINFFVFEPRTGDRWMMGQVDPNRREGKTFPETLPNTISRRAPVEIQAADGGRMVADRVLKRF